MRHDLANRPLVSTLLSLNLLFAFSVQAAEPVAVSNAWARATMPGQNVGAAYLDLRSPAAATLVKAESAAAKSVEIHTMSMNNGVMQMRMLEKLALPAGETVKLSPGGLHLMLFGLKKPLQKGEQITLTLYFEYAGGKTGKLDVSAPVRAVAHQH